MKNEIELEIGPDGTIRTIYQEGIEEFAKEIGGDISTVCRLTDVEWEELNGDKGWTVRAAHNPEYALRYVTEVGQRSYKPCLNGGLVCDDNVVMFKTREDALRAEDIHAAAFIEARRAYNSGTECSIEGSKYGCPCGIGSCKKGHIF